MHDDQAPRMDGTELRQRMIDAETGDGPGAALVLDRLLPAHGMTWEYVANQARHVGSSTRVAGEPADEDAMETVRWSFALGWLCAVLAFEELSLR